MTESELNKEAGEFLSKNVLGVFATVNEKNQPEAAVMMYLADGLDVYFVTRRHTRKFDNLVKNARVAGVVGAVPAPKTVQFEGDAKLLENDQEFLTKLKARADVEKLYFGPFLQLAGTDFAVFKLRIDWMRMLHWDPEKDIEDYHQIIPAEAG